MLSVTSLTFHQSYWLWGLMPASVWHGQLFLLDNMFNTENKKIFFGKWTFLLCVHKTALVISHNWAFQLSSLAMMVETSFLFLIKESQDQNKIINWIISLECDCCSFYSIKCHLNQRNNICKRNVLIVLASHGLVYITLSWLMLVIVTTCLLFCLVGNQKKSTTV